MCRTSDIGLRELDRRRNDGIDVTLFWNSGTNAILVAVQDEREGIAFDLEVDPAEAIEAFRHPYSRMPATFESHETTRPRTLR